MEIGGAAAIRGEPLILPRFRGVGVATYEA